MSRTERFPLAALVALLFIAACSDSPSVPIAAPELLVTVQSPHGDEGAAVLRVGAAGVLAEPAELEGAFVFSDPAEGATLVAVVLDEPGELRFVLRRDGPAPAPDIEVLSVADGEDRMRSATTGYSVRIEPWVGAGGPGG